MSAIPDADDDLRRDVRINVEGGPRFPSPVPGTPACGVFAKLEQAAGHIEAVTEAVARHLAEVKVATGINDNLQTGYREWTISELEMPPTPIEIGLIAGDAVHNLRSALDHLMVQLVTCNDAAPTRDTMFPMAATRERYENGIRNGRTLGASTDAVRRIDALEPYGDGAGAMLWNLHQIDIQDKHKLLIPTVAASTQIIVDARAELQRLVPQDLIDLSELGPIDIPIRNAEAIPLELGAVVYRSTALGDTVSDQTRIQINVALEVNGQVANRAVTETLAEYDRCVRGVVRQFLDLLF